MRLIDVLCDQHRDHILTNHIWPADCPISGTFGNYLDCPDCGNQTIPGHGHDNAEQAAVHEAGHAVLYTLGGIAVDHARIDPGHRNNGKVEFSGTMDRDVLLTSTWGGVAATLHWLDQMRMLDDAGVVDMVATGYGDLRFGLEYVSDLSAHVDGVAEASRLIANHWDAVERVADVLLARGYLTGEEIAAVAGLGCGVAA